MVKQKGFRFSEETEGKLRELVKIYNSKSENHCLKLIIDEIYELKKSRALVPFEELDKRDKELKMAFLKLGEFQGSLKAQEKVLSEKESLIQELKEQLKDETEKPKGFWAKLFGL